MTGQTAVAGGEAQSREAVVQGRLSALSSVFEELKQRVVLVTEQPVLAVSFLAPWEL